MIEGAVGTKQSEAHTSDPNERSLEVLVSICSAAFTSYAGVTHHEVDLPGRLQVLPIPGLRYYWHDGLLAGVAILAGVRGEDGPDVEVENQDREETDDRNTEADDGDARRVVIVVVQGGEGDVQISYQLGDLSLADL